MLSQLRKSKDYDLFCVGDDWQSIYRFAGSDINYILKFEKFWGTSEISKIETTYRFTKSLINISSWFISQNPAQINKSIKGISKDNRFSLGEINAYTETAVIQFMAARLDDLPMNSSVFFIGRYSFDINILNNNPIFQCKYNNETSFINVIYTKRSDLEITYMTAHKSKGLQADYVFILNNKNSRMGFPTNIQDAPILNLLLESNEEYPFAEERRLFYVALTRAKIKSYILTLKNQESVFATQLKIKYFEELKHEQFECPICGGNLVKRSGPYGNFFGCSNYKTDGCKYIRKII